MDDIPQGGGEMYSASLFLWLSSYSTMSATDQIYSETKGLPQKPEHGRRKAGVGFESKWLRNLMPFEKSLSTTHIIQDTRMPLPNNNTWLLNKKLSGVLLLTTQDLLSDICSYSDSACQQLSPWKLLDSFCFPRFQPGPVKSLKQHSFDPDQ